MENTPRLYRMVSGSQARFLAHARCRDWDIAQEAIDRARSHGMYVGLSFHVEYDSDTSLFDVILA